jgi:Ca2+-binding EF-hand superfamily protein
LNVDVTSREVDDLMYQLDADGDGIIKFEEWKNGSN